MVKIRIMIALVLALLFTQSISAQSDAVNVQNKFKQYFRNTAIKVKNTNDLAEKRTILNESFKNMESTLDRICKLPNISKNDISALNSVKSSVQDKYNELNGFKGYNRINDSQLNNFADYVQQDMEQADQWVTISVTTLLIAAILLILLVRS